MCYSSLVIPTEVYADAFVLKIDPAGNVQWYYTFGGVGHDYANSIIQTLDGGYIFAGSTTSFNNEPSGGIEGDIWVVKLDVNGSIQWQKSFGDSSSEVADSIQQTADGGYILGGSDGVIKLNSAGNIQWKKSISRTGSKGRDIQQSLDGGYIFNALYDGLTWLLKLDANGNIQWQKAYNGTSYSYVSNTSDGGYLVGGLTIAHFT